MKQDDTKRPPENLDELPEHERRPEGDTGGGLTGSAISAEQRGPVDEESSRARRRTGRPWTRTSRRRPIALAPAEPGHVPLLAEVVDGDTTSGCTAHAGRREGALAQLPAFRRHLGRKRA